MKHSRSILLIMLILFWYEADAQVKKGDSAPIFKAIDDNGDVWRLKDLIGNKIIVLYFYPAAMTSGCTAQACAYRDDKNMLSALGAKVVGISGDEVENLKWFKEAHNLNFTLLADEKGKIAKKYGVPVKEGGVISRTVNGQEVSLARGVTEMRWTFIIDMGGKIVFVNSEVDAANDSKKVIDVIKGL